MSIFPHSDLVLASGVIRLGPLRFSSYGLCAAAGLISALWLSQRVAPLAGLRAQSLWDAGIFTITAGFILSRALLIAREPHAFLRFPLLVLALPSFTYLGMALTVFATLVYLRARKLPLLRVLDAWSPCAALLATALSLGHFLEGTAEGMPTRMPWGVASPIGRVHPVQLYAAAAALALAAVLWRLLWRSVHASPPLPQGSVTIVAFLAGGCLALLLQMFTQPEAQLSPTWLEPAQTIAIASVAAGLALILFVPLSVTRESRERA